MIPQAGVGPALRVVPSGTLVREERRRLGASEILWRKCGERRIVSRLVFLIKAVGHVQTLKIQARWRRRWFQRRTARLGTARQRLRVRSDVLLLSSKRFSSPRAAESLFLTRCTPVTGDKLHTINHGVRGNEGDGEGSTEARKITVGTTM